MAVVAAQERRRPVSARASRDAVLTAAVEIARAAAEAVADRPQDVGEHLTAAAEDDRVMSHRFACNLRGYIGWHWTVTLARVPRGRTATVSEVELLPGDGALLAPDWLPWADRLRPGDIGPGDVLPFRADDPRLEPGYVATGDPEMDAVAIDELALARARVLSRDGREDAADRWYRGPGGPATSGSVASTAECRTCGFIVPLQGSLGQVFGVCANEWSPDDGRVVSADHGCGAHSETEVDSPPSEWPAPPSMVDHVEVVRLRETESTASAEPTAVPEPDGADAVPEPPAADTAPAPEPTEAASLVSDMDSPAP